MHGSLISADGAADVEPLAINAASAALAASDIPWAGGGWPGSPSRILHAVSSLSCGPASAEHLHFYLLHPFVCSSTKGTLWTPGLWTCS